MTKDLQQRQSIHKLYYDPLLPYSCLYLLIHFFHITASVFISCIACGFLLNAAKPLYLEMICEGVYPVGEGITIGVLNWISNCIGLTFLFVMMIPDIGENDDQEIGVTLISLQEVKLAQGQTIHVVNP